MVNVTRPNGPSFCRSSIGGAVNADEALAQGEDLVTA
jgi:hypothetical protein